MGRAEALERRNEYGNVAALPLEHALEAAKGGAQTERTCVRHSVKPSTSYGEQVKPAGGTWYSSHMHHEVE